MLCSSLKHPSPRSAVRVAVLASCYSVIAVFGGCQTYHGQPNEISTAGAFSMDNRVDASGKLPSRRNSSDRPVNPIEARSISTVDEGSQATGLLHEMFARKKAADGQAIIQQVAGWENQSDPRIAQARRLEQQGYPQDAILEYQRMIAEGFRSPDVLHRLGVLYDKTGQLEKSLPLYREALAGDPENEELLCDFGFRWYMLDNFEQAEHYYMLALQQVPGHARTHNNFGVLLAQSDRPDQALTHFRYAGLSVQEARQNVLSAMQLATSEPTVSQMSE